jgi:hypothetical protein
VCEEPEPSYVEEARVWDSRRLFFLFGVCTSETSKTSTAVNALKGEQKVYRD